MAYTLIIVDDDAVIRKGLSTLIDWEQEGFTLLCECADGREALAWLAKRPVDVVLTDIRMSTVSGLEVARYVHEQRLSTRVVILSGYQEFAYAREAIRYDVMEYLIKPVSMPKVIETFRAVRQALDQQRGQRVRQRSLSARNANLSGELLALLYRDAYAKTIRTMEALRTRAHKAGMDAGQMDRPILLVAYDGNRLSPRTLGAESGGLVIDLEPEGGEGRALILAPGEEQSLPCRILARYVDLSALAGFVKTHAPQDSHGDPVIDAALSCLHEKYGQRVTLSDVAAQVHVNPSYLSRRFKEVTGANFSETLAQIRLDQACDLLRRTNLPVSSIAARCGYPNAKYFYKAFRQTKGATPQNWRANSP